MRRDYLIKPVMDAIYPTISYGKGVFLYDKDGKEYLDGSSGAVTASIGHGVPEIIKSMNKQAEKVSFVYRSQFTSEPAENLAKKISDMTPNDLNWSFFVNSGSEATETAMKIAIQHWQEKGMDSKNKIISRWMSYHGITLGALSMSGHVLRRERFTSLLEDFPSVSAPYCYRCPLGKSYPGCQVACARELERSILRIGADHIAAFIAEPVIGASGGAVVPPEGYYQEIKDICEKYNILFIADEVMTGMGRTGKMLAMEHWDVVPDIVAMGKGLGAGYTPIGATLVSDHVMEPILNGSKEILGGHTLSANPQSSAVALSVLKYIEKHKLVENAEKMGIYLKEKLFALKDRFDLIGNVRGKGLLLGVEFISGKQKQTFPKEVKFTNLVVQKSKQKGLLVYPANAGNEGLNGDAILIAPPLVIKKEEVDELVARFEEALKSIEKELYQNDSDALEGVVS